MLVLVVASIAAPLIARYDPNAQDLLHTYAHPSSAHWLGTDQIGRDVYARMIYAGRVDLLIAFLAVFPPFIPRRRFAAAALLCSRGGKKIAMHSTDIVVAFPFLVLALASSSCSGQGARSIVIAITAHRVKGVPYAHRARGDPSSRSAWSTCSRRAAASRTRVS